MPGLEIKQLHSRSRPYNLLFIMRKPEEKSYDTITDKQCWVPEQNKFTLELIMEKPEPVFGYDDIPF